ncbi:3-hydroxyacyl-CoA dehydrogenase type-2-like [Prorops nasuta]|uniref:3-hydroxyacyl-CoA dehydrogenase type-2-like n=1 Tax=Prorops nasuta TaxID=863751 RepID=UPI0034CE92F6
MKHVIAYITGGACGIGKAVAENIVCQGGKVVIADISCEGPKFAASLGEKALFTCTDVRSEKDVKESIECVRKKFGGINVLVNSAGVLGYERIYDFKKCKPHSMELYRCIFDTNAWGTFNVTRLMAGLIAENQLDCNKQRGVIINIASMLAVEAPPGLVAYGASKAAVVGMTMPIARALAEKGIRVNSVGPGFIHTLMTDDLKGDQKKYWASMNLTPKRFGEPEEVAHLVQSIIENPIINGEFIRVDMGWRYSQDRDNPEDPCVPEEKCKK